MGKGIGISISISKAWKTFRHHWQQRNHKEMDSIVREGLTSNLRGLAMHHNFDTKFSCIYYYIRQLAHHDVPFHAIVARTNVKHAIVHRFCQSVRVVRAVRVVLFR